MHYRLGLDIGITSVGSCVMETDKNGEPIRIEKLATRIFDAAEHPKDGSSLAVPRREARGLRRRLRRKKFRIEKAKQIFETRGVIIKPNTNVNELRVIALDTMVSQEDFANIILLLIKNRGFKSNRKKQKNKEEGELLSAIASNDAIMQEKGYRTIGEMLVKENSCIKQTTNGEIEIVNIRNKAGDYSKAVSRVQIEAEIKVLFAKQREFGNPIANEQIENRIVEIFNWQRNFDEGPGKGSPYSASYNVGECQFEKGEIRAPKASWAFERAIVLQKINNLRFLGEAETIELTKEDRQKILVLFEKKKEVTFADIRKALKLDSNLLFNLANYNIKGAKDLSREDLLKQVEKQKFASMAKSKEIQACLTKENAQNTLLLDRIAVVLTNAKSDDKRIDMFKHEDFAVLSAHEIDNLLGEECDKFGHLSFKALYNILPYLERGLRYSDACKEVGYNHSVNACERQKLLNTPEIYDDINQIGSPVVKRAISQTLKVVNAIIRQYGSPIAINIELAREFNKTKDERNKITRENNERFLDNEKKRDELKNKFDIKPTKDNLVVYKLYEEQHGKCAYSGKVISIDRLFEPNYVQVDHIVPYSRCFDDSFNNKVLVLASENQNKGNKTPYEYIGNTDRWQEFVERVQVDYVGNFRKRTNLLRKTVDEREMKERNLNDTRYICRYVYNLFNDRLLFDDCVENKKRVHVINGHVTAKMRHLLGISKVRADGDKHHAVDACVIACTTDSQVQKLSTIYNNWSTYVSRKTSIEPYPNFVEELNAKISSDKALMVAMMQTLGYTDEQIALSSPMFVSRMPKRKGKGQIHKETIASDKYKDDDIIVKRVNIKNLKLKTDKNGEYYIENYFNKEQDMATYNILLDRLIAFRNDEKNAFVEPIFKPSKEDVTPNQIKKVKVVEKRNSGVEVRQKGFAANGDMVRIDIFTKDSKYYAVPVYTKDIYAKTLPIKAATQSKLQKDWRVMDDSYDFLFSLYPNDLIRIKNNKPINMKKTNNDENSKLPDFYQTTDELLYYTGFDISTSAISVITHDKSYNGRIGITTLEEFEKYDVDVLGNVSKTPVKMTKRIL